MIEVAPLDDRDRDAYEAFVRAHPGGFLYYGLAYRDLVAELLGCGHGYLVAREAGELRGVLPVMWLDGDGGRVYNSLPYYGSHGWALASSPQAEAALCAAWDELAAADGVLAATAVANPLVEPAVLPAHDLVDERISQITPLPETGDDPEAAVMELIGAKRRNDVRRGQRAGVTVDAGVDDVRDRLALLHRIHVDNMRSLGGRAKAPQFFDALPRWFRAGEDFDVWVARKDGKGVAALLVLYYGQAVEYFTPAIDHDHRGDIPLAPILLAAMSEAVRRGFRHWNWGGTWISQDGVYRFKRNWGGEDRRYRYFIRLRDESLLERTPEELREGFGDFYVVPFSSLRPRGGVPSDARS